MQIPEWTRVIARWPAWKLFLAALGVGLLLGLSWQCSKRGAADFFTSAPTGLAAPASDSVPLPDVSAAPSRGGILDALPPRETQSRPAPAPTPPGDAPPTTASDTVSTDPGAPHPENSVAVAISSPAPSYPGEARRAGQHGTVLLRVTVEPDGSTSDVGVEKSSGHRALDRAAQQALRRWRFQPAFRNSVAIRSEVRVPVTFELGN